MTEITIPGNVIEIDDGSFSNCTSLSKISFDADSKLHIIESEAFANTVLTGTVNIPKSVRTMRFGAFENVTTLSKLVIPYARAMCPYVSAHPYGLDETKTEIIYGGAIPEITPILTPKDDASGKKKYNLDFNISFKDKKDGTIYDAVTRVNLPNSDGELSGNIFNVGQSPEWTTSDAGKTIEVTKRGIYKIQVAGLDGKLHDYEILVCTPQIEREAIFFSGDMKTLTANQVLYRLGAIDKDGNNLIKDEFGDLLDCTYTIDNEEMNKIHKMKSGEDLTLKIGIHDKLFDKDYEMTVKAISTNVKGKIVWNDHDDAYGIRPGSVNVSLVSQMHTTAKAATVLSTKAVSPNTSGEWNFEFGEVSPFEMKEVGGVVGTFHCGDELKYSVDSTAPNRYSMDIKENPTSYFTITMTVQQVPPYTGIKDNNNKIVELVIAGFVTVVIMMYVSVRKKRDLKNSE